jgi:hypothetical protein
MNAYFNLTATNIAQIPVFNRRYFTKSLFEVAGERISRAAGYLTGYTVAFYLIYKQ